MDGVSIDAAFGVDVLPGSSGSDQEVSGDIQLTGCDVHDLGNHQRARGARWLAGLGPNWRRDARGQTYRAAQHAAAAPCWGV